MKKCILFVDDEPKILEGLGRMLRVMRHEWDMHFATGGPEALDLMARQSIDLVISDMRMPVMSGLEFLTEVKARYPNVIRIVLSGHADQLLIMRAVGVAHQYLSKPCEAEALQSMVTRALELRALLSNDPIKRLISRLSVLPSLPSLYSEVVSELQSADGSIRRVGEIIAKDPGMTAKILQLVNSAFFGIRRVVSNPMDAAAYLGLEIIQSLVLSLHAFARFEACQLPGCSIDQIWSHSMAAGLLAKRIMMGENAGRAQAAEAFTAGLLHDLGKLVLAANLPQEYGAVHARSARGKVSLQDAEREVLGSTHAEIGAYLLGLWGLPDPIIEAVALHHCPGACADKAFGLLCAVHAANALEEEHSCDRESQGRDSQLDLTYLDAIGKASRLEDWRTWGMDPSLRGAVA
jgi:HD-like signal output (HDOD) protein/CheY-like chemotaxis protein